MGLREKQHHPWTNSLHCLKIRPVFLPTNTTTMGEYTTILLVATLQVYETAVVEP